MLREIGRTILQATLRSIERGDPDDVPARIDWRGDTFRRNRMTNKTIDTRFGPFTFRRWFFQNTLPGEPGMAPLDLRLGWFGGRMTPARSEVAGRLAADVPQQAVLEVLRERFAVTPSVATLRTKTGGVSRVVQSAVQQKRAACRESYKARLNKNGGAACTAPRRMTTPH